MKKVMSMIRAVAVLGMGFAVVAPSQADCVGWTSRSTLAFTPEPAGQAARVNGLETLLVWDLRASGR